MLTLFRGNAKIQKGDNWFSRDKNVTQFLKLKEMVKNIVIFMVLLIMSSAFSKCASVFRNKFILTFTNFKFLEELTLLFMCTFA